MVNFGDIISNLGLGFSVALSLDTLFYCFLGVTVGTLIGVLPGISVLATIAMLIPITFHLDSISAIVMLAGIYYGAAYGGSTAAILLNLPGTPTSAVTCLDGYPMAKQGRGGIALFITTIASFAGSFAGILIVAILAPALASVALGFGSPEYFALMLLGVLAASLLSSGKPFRSITMLLVGLALGIVGIDMSTGQFRFTFGTYQLYDGLPLVAVVVGLFGMPELISKAGRFSEPTLKARNVSLRSMLPTREDWRRSAGAMLRGSGIGSFFGTLPGTGGTIASFMSYAVEKRIHKDPSQFGRGAIEGISGPEASNNAAAQTAFIPTLTLGIPGDAIMAVMLGVLTIHGIAPGPQLISGSPDLFWGLLVSFLMGNLMLLVLNIPLIGIWIRILTIPFGVLYPIIIGFICIGVYSVNNSIFDLYVLVAFSVVGYGLLLLRFEPAPLILGLILGPMMEENLRRSMVLSGGDPMIFLHRPLSAAFLGLCVLLLVWMMLTTLRSRRARPAA